MRKRRVPRVVRAQLLAAVAAASLSTFGCAADGSLALDQMLDQVVGGAGGAQNLSTVAAGLKEALRVGTSKAVERTSQADGYLGNPLIRVPLPESLEKMANGLRAVGFRRQVDEFEVAMNRAAEQAAGEATDIFWDGITQMTFADARAILAGDDTAATQYFERTTRDPLRSRFSPIVDQKLSAVGAVQVYDDLVTRYTTLPFTSKPQLDLRSYVTEKALDGLFLVLGEEEKKIRTDPQARVTELLKTVFGN